MFLDPLFYTVVIFVLMCGLTVLFFIASVVLFKRNRRSLGWVMLGLFLLLLMIILFVIVGLHILP